MSEKKKGKSSQKMGFLNALNCASGKSETQQTMVPQSTQPLARLDANDPRELNFIFSVLMWNCVILHVFAMIASFD